MSECTLSKFADGTKLGETANIPEGCATVQRDFDRLEKHIDRNLMQFWKGKYKVLTLIEKGLDKMISSSPFQPQPICDMKDKKVTE